MVEKRPHPGDHGSNGVKRAKPTTSGGPANSLLESAKAKAAQKAAEIKARLAAGSAGANNASASPTPSQSPAPAAGGLDRLAAMKAKLAAMKAPPASTDAPPVRPSPSVSNMDDGGSKQNENRGPRFATTLGNRRTDTPPARKTQKPAPQEEQVSENPYFDPSAAGTRSRVSRKLLFHERGKYLDQASKLRTLGALEQLKKTLALKNRQARLDENTERGFLIPAPPDVEWWDEGLLEEKTYDCIDNASKVKIDSDDSIVTIYVQHPAILKANQDSLLVPVKPMYLTQKEQAKLRRMRRAEQHKEEQAKIRLGLEPPPPPKIKRGNMMRVLGEQAIADPTAVEMLVEGQIRERHEGHLKANEERKLTKEQRHAKLAENQSIDAQKGLHMCVFKVDSLAFGKHRFQIDNNGKQLALTGLTIFSPDMNLVIVEGGAHSISKFRKLMTHRIKWGENAFPTETQVEKQANDPQWMKPVDDRGQLKDLSGNRCLLVFQGEVKARAFRKWGSKMCATDGEAIEVLARNKLDSLWALAKSTE